MPVGINPWVLPVGALIGVVITAFVTWRIAARKNSGQVAFTEAEILWRELRAELVEGRAREQRQQVRIESLELALEKSRQESIASRVESAAARAESAQLRVELADFTKAANGMRQANG